MKISVLTINDAALPQSDGHQSYCSAWQYEHFNYIYRDDNPIDLIRHVENIALHADWTLVAHQHVDLAGFGIPVQDLIERANTSAPLILAHTGCGIEWQWPSLSESLMLIRHTQSTQAFLDLAASVTDTDINQWLANENRNAPPRTLESRLSFAAQTSQLPCRSLTLPRSATKPNPDTQPTYQNSGQSPSHLPSNVRYWTQSDEFRNFGDYLTEYFFEKLFYGVDVNAQSIHVIGSVISDEWIPTNLQKTARSGGLPNTTIYWSCGARSRSSLNHKNLDLCRISCVRGPLTRDALGLPNQIPLGDSGLLLPSLYQPQCDAAYIGKNLTIPHIEDPLDDEALIARTGCDIVLRPKIRPSLKSIEEFIDRIASAKFVLCGSLHAAITAAAYGIPFAYLKGGKIDIPFKWEDFSASINIPCRFITDIESGTSHYEQQIKPNLRLPILTPMLLTAPFPIRPKALLSVYQRDIALHGNSTVRLISKTQEHPFFMDFYGAAEPDNDAHEKDESRFDILAQQVDLKLDRPTEGGKLKFEVWKHSTR
ncbi:polysaccharide pyruvyl transferase family protein [Burkholderia cepacia]|uniref:polysaccharide pyruvyl transferase family protein n=1 Tax=Burkholderia cepacia TaxID=292 RepID=UPI0035289390